MVHRVGAGAVPCGAIHLLDHNRVRQVNSAFVTVEARPGPTSTLRNKNVGDFDSYFPTPFRIVIENGSGQLLTLKPRPKSIRGRKRSSATPGIRMTGENHLILATEGRDHFVGVSLSVDDSGAGWWEGDEMMWVDGQASVTIHGTGTEDERGHNNHRRDSGL